MISCETMRQCRKHANKKWRSGATRAHTQKWQLKRCTNQRRENKHKFTGSKCKHRNGLLNFQCEESKWLEIPSIFFLSFSVLCASFAIPFHFVSFRFAFLFRVHSLAILRLYFIFIASPLLKIFSSRLPINVRRLLLLLHAAIYAFVERSPCTHHQHATVLVTTHAMHHTTQYVNVRAQTLNLKNSCGTRQSAKTTICKWMAGSWWVATLLQ